jgi:hypothetical protein
MTWMVDLLPVSKKLKLMRKQHSGMWEARLTLIMFPRRISQINDQEDQEE